MISSASDDDPKLPKDVAVEVLKRLPVESLLRFRCVCRSWRSTIDDPRFVALHLNHCALDASNWHLVALHGDYPVRNLCCLLSGESLAPPSVSQIEIPFSATSSSNYGFVVGSCNDLICVMEYGHGHPWSMYLWNLFTRKYREVRPSTLASEYLSTRAIGIGFDARSNDHKIVILYDDNVQRLETRVQIYSLRTDSWRSLECEVPAFCRNTSSVFFNGNLHWFVPKHDGMWWESGYRSIVLFDVVNEVFDEMVPSEKFLHVISVSSEAVLSVLNDLLAVCTIREETVGHPETLSICSVWVMREYGVPDSWTELYCFQTSEQVLGIDGFTRNGDLLLKIDDGAKRVSRNPITGQFTNLSLQTHRNFYTVVESLVSP